MIWRYLQENLKARENCIKTITIHGQDTGIEFNIEKWAMLIMKKVGWLVGFYGISAIVGYLMPNLFYSYK